MTSTGLPQVSRRDFIKGVIAAGAAVSTTAYLFRTSILGQPSAPGAVERLITLNVNGQMRRVDVMKQETLAMTLRYKLGLTGTKLGCDRAECGACTVLIDDAPRRIHAEVLTMADYKYLGKDYSTPDLVAKVTGKAKYAEDYRAEGMLFCKLLLSPLPHGRVRGVNATRGLALP